jgi:anaerobic ribonucleoside-triphosphate reductase activating protein
MEGGRKYTQYTAELLSYIQVLIVGPYKQEQRDITDNNRWRGSRNQRVLDVQKSLNLGYPVAIAGLPNNELP